MRYLIENLPYPVSAEAVREIATALNLPFTGRVEGGSPDVVVESSRDLTEAEFAALQTAIKQAVLERMAVLKPLPSSSPAPIP